MARRVRLAYPAELSTDRDGRVLVQFPDIPEALTDGADRAEALREAKDCLEEAVAGYIRRSAVPDSDQGRTLPGHEEQPDWQERAGTAARLRSGGREAHAQPTAQHLGRQAGGRHCSMWT